jgi:ribosomal protein S18 acetylase RimI-like enzyme
LSEHWTANIVYHVNPAVSNQALNDLFAAAWSAHCTTDFEPILSRSLAYICAYDNQHLAGFVNVAWDGGVHAFLLDTTVHPEVQRRGIGQQLVREAIDVARSRGIVWLHVDYEPHLDSFYRTCGFWHTNAGLIQLREIT